MQPGELPPTLGVAFGVGAARRAGVSRSRLRGRDLERTFYGTRAVAGASLVADEADDAKRAYPRSAQAKRVHERAAQYAPVMSNRAFFTGVTAAVLWDVPLPPWLFQSLGVDGLLWDPDVLEVAVHWPARAPRGIGVSGHAVRPQLVRTVTHPVSRLRVASPASTWATLAPALPHPYDLVAAADHFARVIRPPHSRPRESMPAPLATITQLTAVVAAGRRTGVRRLQTALPRVRTGSASRPETWTRLTLVDAGLPEPVLDHDVFDGLGCFLARVDMAYPEGKIAIEYEGTHHSAGAQWERDIDRYAALDAEGWLVIRVTRAMLFRNPDKLVARVRHAIARRSR